MVVVVAGGREGGGAIRVFRVILNEVVKLIVKFVARRPLRGLSARSAPSGGTLVLLVLLGIMSVLVWL